MIYLFYNKLIINTLQTHFLTLCESILLYEKQKTDNGRFDVFLKAVSFGLRGGFCGACRLQKNAPRGLGQGIAPRQRAKHTARLWLAPCLTGGSSATTQV
jgi:hypothetical protein